ncbi:MAG: O-antigen ligase family protein [Rhodospirillales bacterium]|nr:O-antigen ligase family protein [Rhodospirillales bacterium]
MTEPEAGAAAGTAGRLPRMGRLLRDEPLARRIAFGATLLLPPVLLATRAGSDALLSLVAILFLATRFAPASVGVRWSWTLRPWHALALLFWAWQVAVSVAVGDGHQIVESLVLLRLFVFLAALEGWVLAEPSARRWLGWVVLATALWVGVECWQQYLTGTNMFGDPRWGDGALTGPIYAPRAGPTFVLLAFPAFLPVLARLLGARRGVMRGAGVAGLALLAVTQVLIGQRMPMLLLVLGFGIIALWIPRLRMPVAIAIGAGVVLAALSAIVSPPTYAKLVVHFSQQMEHFRATQYADLFERAAAMVVAHPWLGLGFDGFRDHCLDHAYFHNLAWFAVADPTSPLGCSIHPHNYYLQVATGAGLPGLALFVLLAIAWLWRLGHGAGASALRVGLFTAAALILWPIASTTSLFTLPNAGWSFLLIGWGLAEARAAAAARG